MTRYTGPMTVHFRGRTYTVEQPYDGRWEWRVDGPPPRVGGGLGRVLDEAHSVRSINTNEGGVEKCLSI